MDNMITDKLTDKQEAFCYEYLIDLNATQAAIRAGYSIDTAKEQGCQNLTKLNIQQRIAELKAERNKRMQIDADYVLTQAVKLHERCMQEVRPKTFKGNQVYDEMGNAVYEFNASGAAKSLELIGKHVEVQAFKENIGVKDETPDRVEKSPLNDLPIEKLKEIQQIIKG